MNLATNTRKMAPAPADLPISGHIFAPAASKGLVVRLAESHDAVAIARIGWEGFSLAHRDAFQPDDLESILDNTYTPEAVLHEIRDRQKRLFVAEVNGDVVGIVRLRPGAAPINLPALHPVELTWMYLSPQSIGKGVGSALMSRALEQARADGADVLWLTVWTSNQRAIPFYKRWGFRVAGMKGVAVGHSRPIAYIMAQTINHTASLQ